MATATQTALPAIAQPSAVSVKHLVDSGVPNWQVLDIRSASEFAAGHIPTSINIPIEELPSRIADLRPAKTVVICQQGFSSKLALNILGARAASLNLSGASILEGGFNAWVLAGQPIITTTATRWSIERQVRTGAGTLLLLAILGGFTVSHNFFYLAGLFALSLTVSGITNFCGMAKVLALMPWNTPPKPTLSAQDPQAATPTACSLSKRCCQ